MKLFGALACARRKYSLPFRRAGARQSQILTTVSARWRAPITDIHHSFGELARASRKYHWKKMKKYTEIIGKHEQNRRAGARQSQIFTTVSARWRAPVANIHHRFGALARARRKYSPPFRRAGARQS